MQGYTRSIPTSTDGTLSPNSGFLVPTQNAVATYVQTQIAGITVGGGVNTSAQYTFSNTITFTGNINSTIISIGNSTVNNVINSTVFSGTANNVLYLGGAAASVYVNTSAAFTLGGAITFNANVTLVGNTTSVLSIGNSTVNIGANSSVLNIGAATINSTVFSGTSNNATNLGGAPASVYVNTSGSFSLAGVITENANLVVNGATLIVSNSTYTAISGNLTTVLLGASTGLNANGSIGTNGQYLTSNGTTIYWNNLTGGNNTDIQYNNSGSIAANDNFQYNYSTGTMDIGNTTVNTNINSSFLSIVNSTAFSNLTLSGFFTTAGSISISNTAANVTITSTIITAINATSNSNITPGVIQSTNATGKGALYPGYFAISSNSTTTTGNLTAGPNYLNLINATGTSSLSPGTFQTSNATARTITGQGYIQLQNAPGVASVQIGNTTANSIAYEQYYNIVNATAQTTLSISGGLWTSAGQLNIGNTTSNSIANNTALVVQNATDSSLIVPGIVTLDSLTTTYPTKPSRGSALFVQNTATRNMLGWISSAGTSGVFQPALFGRSIGYTVAVRNVAAPTSVGQSTTNTLAQTARALATGNNFLAMKRTGLVTGTTNGAIAELRQAQLDYWFGSGTDSGGFHIVFRVGVAIATANAGAFVGLTTSTAAIANAAPNTFLSSIGFYYNGTGTDTTWSFMTSNATVVNTISLGAGFASNVGNTYIYDFHIFSAPNNGGINYRAVEVISGNTITGSANAACVPASTSTFAWHVAINPFVTAAAAALDFSYCYAEVDM